jgi:hypothetical protein
MARRQDAFKIYCDEGYHSLYSLDLADQIAAVTAIPIPQWKYDGFVTRLELAGNRLLPDKPELVELLRAVVFETLITSVLNELPADVNVMTTVRDVMRDHARDEGHHHRYFAAFFQSLWTRLDTRVRGEVALVMPALIDACLRWDSDLVRASLALAGVDEDTAKAIVVDVYQEPRQIAAASRATVKLCEATGVLDVPGATEAFAAYGLGPGAAGVSP